YVNGMPKRYPLRLTEVNQVFQWQVEQQPDLVLVDPERQLLGVILHDKPLDMLAAQAKLSSHFYYRLVALGQLAEYSQDSIQVQTIARQFLEDTFWLNRVVGIGAFEEYQGDDQSALSVVIRELAREDPVPAVRAEALSILSTFPSVQHMTDIYEALKDSAYSVVGNAISLLSEQEIPSHSLVNTIQPYESYQNVQVVLPLADLFVNRMLENKLPWFIANFQSLQGADRFYFIAYFSEYLLLLPEKDRTPGMEALLSVAENDNNYYVRAASVNALQMLDFKGVWEEKIATIIDTETDPRFFDFFGATIVSEGE
ncbi:MAG: hypothetical protein AAFQ98_07050, partial [Bacteroidota bacterium]